MATSRNSRRAGRAIGVGLLSLILCFALSAPEALSQTKPPASKSLLSSLAARSSGNMRVGFSYSPRFPREGQAVQFTDATTGDPVSWQWDFGDGSTSSARNPIHIYTASGFRKITLMAGNGAASKKATKTLTVLPPDSPATFVFSPVTPGPGQTVQFADTTPGDPTSWQWTFGDGATSSAKNPAHAFATTGSYTVALVATTPAGTKLGNKTITVANMSVLDASFSFSPASPVSGQSVQFTDTSAGTPTAWSWNFGDGGTSTAQNPSHTYTTAGIRTVTLTVTNASGSSSETRTVTVTTALSASFTFTPASPTTGQTIQFTDTSAGTPTAWAWNFGDGAGSSLQNPSHGYTTGGSKTVTLTITNASGSTSATRTIAVAAALSASFTFTPASPTAGQAVQFTDTSTGSPSIWQWSFGDGTTSTVRNPSHVFTTAGARTVSLTVMNASSSNSTTRTVTVTAGLTASFTYTPATPVAGQSVQYMDASTGNPTAWSWNFGDGASSTTQNPNHTFAAAGSYTVNLTVTSASGSAAASRVVSVEPAATLRASFAFSPASPAPEETVRFTDASTGSPTAWQWNFGDGTTSTSPNPSHAFAGAGSYQVTLTVSNASASDLETAIVTVAGDPPPGGDHDWLLVDQADRVADWSLAGVWRGGTQGIPVYPTGIAMQASDPTAAHYLDPTGSADCTAAIQGAINAAPAGTTVLLPAGTFRTTGSITDSNGKSVVVKGAGAGVTTIRISGGSGAAISFTGNGPGASFGILSGYQTGSTAFVLSGASGLAVGQYALVSETNDDNFLGGSTTYMNNAVGQIVRISSISGTTVRIDRPLYYAHSASATPTLQRLDTIDAVGVEDLSIDCNASDTVTGIRFLDVTNGWIRKVEVTGSVGWHVTLNRSARCEVSRNFIHHGRNFETAYGICLYGRSTDNLIEDNIIYYQRHHISFEYSGSGNVIGYNFCNIGYDGNYPAIPPVMQSIHNHGGFQCMNLLEGNSADQINHDSYLSQCASDGMFLFRNHSRAFSINAAQGRRFAFENAVRGYRTSLVGNVLGTEGDLGVGSYEAVIGEPFTRSVYRVGWHGSVSTGTAHGVVLPDTTCAATMWREGNFDYFSGQTRWDGGRTEAIPASLYRPSKPSWFGALAWPPVGPDVPGYVTRIPAKARWDAYVGSSSLRDIFADTPR